jgi:hypothetical protein
MSTVIFAGASGLRGGLSAAVITLLIVGAGTLALRQGGWTERFSGALRRR